MAENKTKPTNASVEKFLDSIDNKRRREDARVILKVMKSVTRMKPKMWGPVTIGFGSYHYKYESGREGDSPLICFSPRKQSLTLGIMSGIAKHEALLKKLGKHTTGKICLYITNLDNIDMPTLKELLKNEFAHMKKRHSKKK